MAVLGKIFRIVRYLVIGVGGVFRVVEDDLVDGAFFRAYNKALLICVGHHAGDGNKGLRDHGLAVFGNGLFGCDGCTGFLIQILDGVGHCLSLDIPEGVDIGVVLLGGIDVQRQGVALGYREVALLIVGVQVGAALGLKGLGNARQPGAGGGVCDFGVGALNLIINGVLLQDIGAPLAVYLHILVYRHIGEVKGFLNTVFHVEPANEGIAAVGRLGWNGVNLGAVGNGDVRMRAQLGAVSQRILIQIELDLVGHGYPLGIEQDVVRGHSVLVQLVLRAGALGV